ARAIEQVREQQGDPIEIVVVGNGIDVPDQVPEFVRTVRLPRNVGITGGRNAGLNALREHSQVDAVLFLDDDGWLGSPTVAEVVRERFEADPRLGIVSFRITDPD